MVNRENIIRMAREAGMTVCRDEWVFGEMLERFAALVAKHTLANIDPSSFMSWREGYAAGAAAEREACVKLADEIARDFAKVNFSKSQIRAHAARRVAIAIRARRQK